MSRYARLSLKMQSITDGLLDDDESPFSGNMVTGESINFPIVETCKPTKVCAQTCYAACGPITWSASLKKQMRVRNSCIDSPIGFAERVIRFRKMDYITWNGAGDLFLESIEALDRVAVRIPWVPIWVRTRIPQMAVKVTPRPNVYVHFSLDRFSLNRKDEVAVLGGIKAKHHFSYQYDKGETTHYPDGIKIVFGDNYKLPDGIHGPEVCPLNTLESIADACRTCRRCFKD